MPADLVTRLLLQNEQFDRNLKESRAQLQAFNKRIEAGAASVRSFVAGFTGLAGVSFAFMDIAQKSIQFEKSLSSLRSLTGLSAKDMEFFKQKAIELGSTSTQTASQVVEAFQLIGSQQPELLKNKEALAEVTKQAIILAEAAGMDVPEAAKALSGSINQMGESADVAGEYINILAAASQAGSADIQYLAKAIEKSGGAASSVGVKYNELVAAIEAIAPKITEASEAGTNLRNIFLTLESSSDKNLKPSVVGLTKALDNLAAKNLDATQMTKMFGKESVTAALAIVNAKEDYKKYIEAITGTNTALEQQNINNDNLAGSLSNVYSAWEKFVLTLNKSNGALKETADLLTSILHGITDSIKSEEQKQTDAIERSYKKRKEALNKDISLWEKTGLSRKEAIGKVLSDLPKNYDIPDLNELDKEEKKLKSLEATYSKIKNKNSEINPFKYNLVSKLNSMLMPGYKEEDLLIDVNPNTSGSTNRIKDQINAQKELVAELRIKNEAYQKSIQYLDEELKATEKLDKENDKPKVGTKLDSKTIKELSDIRSSISWTQNELDKLSKPISIDIEPNEVQTAEYLKELNEEAKKNGLPIKPELSEDDLANLKIKLATKMYIPVVPQLEEPEEAEDITGSIADYQKRIQNIIIAYNEATNSDLRKLYAEQVKDLEDQMEKMEKAAKDTAMDLEPLLKNALGSAATSGFEAIGEALASSDPTEALRSMLASLMDILKQFGSALVALGAAQLALKASISNPYAAIAAGGALIIAAAAAKAALQKVAKPMANGGIVYGETFARVGEYPGAASNPEVVAPLNKLKDIIEPKSSRYEEIRITGELIGRGSNLVAVVDNYGRKQGRIK